MTEYKNRYNPEVDYKTEHLKFLKSYPHFVPAGGFNKKEFPTYYHEMVSYYKVSNYNGNLMFFHCYVSDYDFLFGDTKEKTKQRACELFGNGTEVIGNEFFVTFNFDPKKWNAKLALNHLAKFLEKKWVKKCRGVFEYFGKDENHPHLMLYLTTELKFGKLKDKLSQVSLFTKLMSGLNFLDIKDWVCDRHEPYINLQKRESKQENLAKDELWRIEQNLPHKVEK